MQNTGSAHELVVHTVSSDSTAFFPLSFEVTTVAPGERTAIQVAYLPRATGEDHGTIVIHTSAGAFIVRLEGVGQQSPYSVAPLTGVTAPVGVHREYLLSMHNPFKETLWIKEVGSSLRPHASLWQTAAEVRNALLGLVAQLANQATGKGPSRDTYWGQMVTQTLPRAAVGPLVDRLKTTFIRQFAARGGPEHSDVMPTDICVFPDRACLRVSAQDAQ